MKVHIIISNYKDYTSEGQGINSVYFSYKKAKKVCDKHNKGRDRYNYYEIESVILEDPENYKGE